MSARDDTLLRLDRLSVRRGRGGRRLAVADVTLELRAGEMVGLIGPNGAGKTSLLRAALGLLPATGHSDLAALPAAARARRAAWLPQAREIAWPVTVADLVALGRLPHRGAGAMARAETAQDRAAVEAALARLNLRGMRNRIATRLSGGEQARVLIARALAQEAPLLMADEPVAGLDPGHQIAVMEEFAALAREDGHAVFLSLHDLGLAARHCTRLVMLDHGRIVADGTPDRVLRPDLLAQVFGIEAHFETGPDGPVFAPLRVVPR
ncbi:MAG: ABC transporter ATP-binding protein [Celeribacter sp.]|jgi:iron complex transport system ATP-binding protein